MAFQQPAALPRQSSVFSRSLYETSSREVLLQSGRVEESQEWILFSPSQARSSTNQTQTTRIAGASRASDFGSLNTAARSGRLESEVLEEEPTEDGELDSLDEGLNAFREPTLYQSSLQHDSGALLPTHDGLGTFPASNPAVQDQLWQHELYNPKRKHDGQHRRRSSMQIRLDTIGELDAQATEANRMRIEKWRIEQSSAFLEEVERETRRRLRRPPARHNTSPDRSAGQDVHVLGTTPTQSDYMKKSAEESDTQEPFWRRITRKFIRDVIGIDEPLLSVILGESLPAEVSDLPPSSTSLPVISEDVNDEIWTISTTGLTWRDRLLHRIARELGVLVHQISPHPGAFSTYTAVGQHYAGIPIGSRASSLPQLVSEEGPETATKFADTSTLTPNFPPTVQDPGHAESWGLEDEFKQTTLPTPLEDSETLRREREYWEQQLDIKMVFRYLKSRFSSRTPTSTTIESFLLSQDAAKRAAMIRQQHPLVARAQRSPARTRRDSRFLPRKGSSSCVSESLKSSRKASLVRSGSSSRNYWDIGGSAGSGSILASGGLMGAWGEV